MTVAFRVFTLGLLLILTIPRMTQPGMFSDGVVYASIARNMAEGSGGFWAPEYTKTVYPIFHEHPPLGLWLESIFFRVLGDHPYVERACSLLFALLQASLIVLLWRVVATKQDRDGDWLPLLFWVLPSFVTWSVVNNMLENMQAVFTTAAVIAVVIAMTIEVHWIVSVLAGIAVGAAVLTKGPVGLFPLAAPALYAVICGSRLEPDATKRWGKRAVIVTLVMCAVLAILAAEIWAQPRAKAYLHTYLRAQLMPSLSGQREVAPSHWRFAALFGLDIVARMAGLLLAIWALTRRAWVRGTSPEALFFLYVGLTASLPIAISPKMMGHYLVPSVPMFALACALYAWPAAASASRKGAPHGTSETAVTPWREPLWFAYLIGGVGVVLIAAALALPFLRGPLEERDATRLAALDLVRSSLHPGAVVATCAEGANNWPLHAYLQRFFHISLDPNGTRRPAFLRLTDRPCEVPAGCALAKFAGDLEVYSCPP